MMQLTSVAPNKLGVHIKCRDLVESRKFYEMFGFKVAFVYGSDEHRARFPEIASALENYNGIVYQLGEALFEIADGHVAVKPEVFQEQVSSSKISLMVDVASVEPIKDIAVRNKLDIAADVREFHWGTREIVLRDPDGVIVVFREKIS